MPSRSVDNVVLKPIVSVLRRLVLLEADSGRCGNRFPQDAWLWLKTASYECADELLVTLIYIYTNGVSHQRLVKGNAPKQLLPASKRLSKRNLGGMLA